MPGLVLFLGPAAWVLLGALLLASPYVIAIVRRLVAKRLRPTDIESVGLASPDVSRRLQWVESTRQLHSASSDEDRLLVVELRAHILDDLVDRYGAELPVYVWTELHDSGGPDHAPGRPGHYPAGTLGPQPSVSGGTLSVDATDELRGATMSTHTYPVRVDARLDPQLSRWLWLVKWVLVIPHYIVLVFLWIAFAVMSVVAFFAILFTGRYPRADLRLQRRCDALDLAGHLLRVRRAGHRPVSAVHPPRRSRLPGAAACRLPRAPLPWAGPGEVVAAGHPALPRRRFLRRRRLAPSPPTERGRRLELRGGLIGLLVLVAAVVLPFTGRYPRPIFDLILGLNRWVLRVAAYVGLS